MSSSYPTSCLPVLTRRLLPATFVLAVLAGCGSSHDKNDTEPAPEPTPTPTPVSPYVDARAGDVLKVQIKELHPTQPSVGYDQIYYHLGRKQPDLNRYQPTEAGYLGDDDEDNYSRYIYRTERKRIDDYCADNGQGGVASFTQTGTRLIDSTSYTCSLPEPTPDAAADILAQLKTVVVGPGGTLYLTDGHHTFTTLKELADGGEELPVWVRVAANYSGAETQASFWQQMQDARYVWLEDPEGKAITPDQLPDRLGLDTLSDDKYRSLVYLTRGMGYDNSDMPEFAEFYWGSWLRENGPDLSQYKLTDLARARIEVKNGVVSARSGDSTDSYVAAVRDAALRMVALDDTATVSGGRLAGELGRLDAPAAAKDWNDFMEDEIWRADTNSSGRYRTAGKAWYALKYRECGGAANTQPACWLQP